MLNFFLSQNPLGINISDSSIKVVQLGNQRDITAINKIKVPEGIIVNGEIIKHDEVVKLIKDLIRGTNKKTGISTKEVICSLPENLTYLKYLKTDQPLNANAEISASILNYFPQEIDKLYIDWQILNPDKKNKLTNAPQEIIVGGGSKQIIEEYTAILEEADLFPISLELESLAIARAIVDEKTQNTENIATGILDIGEKSSIFIIYNKNVRFSIIIPFSGDKITELIAETLNISNKQAEKAKRLCGLDQKKAQGAVKKILTPLTSELIKKIKEIEQYYINYQGGEKLNKIILSGGAANLQAIDKLIQEENQIAVEINNPLINLKNIASEPGGTKQELLSYTTAIGLALNGLQSP